MRILQLGVDYMVEGGVHREQDHLTINVQLIQVRDQMDLFARKYDAGLRDMFEVMNQAASDIAESIGISLEPIRRCMGGIVGGHARKQATEELAAYNEYNLARYVLGSGEYIVNRQLVGTAEGFVKASS